MNFPIVSFGFSSKIASIKFHYSSRKEQETNRKMDVTGFDDFYLEGHCYLRNKVRTFNIEYISSCVDADTGKPIVNIQYFLREKLRDYNCKDTYDTLNKLLVLDRDFLLVLVYIGRLSYQLRPAKKTIIAEACRQLTGDMSLNEDHFAFLSNGCHFFNTSAEFESSVIVLSRNKNRYKDIIIEAATKLTKIPKKGAEQELEALRYIQSEF